MWQPGAGLYRCGMITAPSEHMPRTLRWLSPIVGRLARRWIAAGMGCDSDLLAEPPSA
jgi:hypothetical protein